jgi:hypothetical protein
LAIERGVIPPNANFENLNPQIDAEFFNLQVSQLWYNLKNLFILLNLSVSNKTHFLALQFPRNSKGICKFIWIRRDERTRRTR